jgi:murein DD-endopeptidase MepM/ murein hydrolase activator NlpD
MSMADVFECQVDFATDLRAGDDFKVYFEYAVKGGRRAGKGRILAAELTVNGQSHRAYYYSYPEGGGAYYDDKGRSMARRFLRAPLNYRRISSSFSYKRFHPILKIYRPHLGIDYAAPTGTPVSAIGSGKVSYVGWKGGYGRYVEIRHDRTYKSTYAHLSRYANGVRAGSRVTKGQVIGYVGSSGLSTGPHLDFRFYKNGKAINFLKTKFPHSKSIPESEVPDFEKVRKQYIAVLEGNRMVLSSKGEGLR